MLRQMQLPIASRELRVASRKRSTFWVRLIAVLTASIICSGFMVLSFIGVPGAPTFGSPLLRTLSWLAFLGTSLSGVFLTSDCLSEEKREGTLGLLFLTDLRGFDVTSGKLLATSLQGFYSVLAVLPVLSVTVLLGGVTGGEIARTSLALLNSLFCSLCCGLLVSSIHRDGQRAMVITLLLVLLLNIAGPILDPLLNLGHQQSSPVFVAALTSPAIAFLQASDFRGSFWLPLITSHLVGWGLFGLASVILPRSWQARGSLSRSSSSARLYSWKYGGPVFRAARRSRLLDINPVVWLVLRERWQAGMIWLLAVLFAGAVGCLLYVSQGIESWMVGSYMATLLIYGLYIWSAARSARFFIESRRTGLLELMLSSPLDARRIVQGQWQALLRVFAAPLLLILVPGAALTGLSHMNTYGSMPGIQSGPGWILFLAGAAAALMITLCNLIAITWFGMWMGLSSRNANMAALKTIAFVQVIPALVLGFVSGLITVLVMLPSLMTASNPGRGSMNILSGVIIVFVPALLTVGKDLFFIILARRKLCRSLREVASRLPRTVASVPGMNAPALAARSVPTSTAT
jgi:hypothetical protein